MAAAFPLTVNTTGRLLFLSCFMNSPERRRNVVSDWIATDQSIVRPMIEASAAQYAKEKGITPRDCSKEK